MDNLFKSYNYHEKQSQSKFNRRLIDGTITGCGNCVGFCEFAEHRGFLNKKICDQHECIKKDCKYFVAKPKYVGTKKQKENLSNTICSIAKKMVENYEYMKVVRAVSNQNEKWYIDYVSISDNKSFKMFEKTITDAIGIPVEFRKLNWPFETCAQYIFNIKIPV